MKNIKNLNLKLNNYVPELEKLIAKTNNKTVFNTLGINIEKLDADQTIVSINADHKHLQHAGLVHGGVYVLLAESAVSLAAACSLTKPGQGIVAIEINANHIKSTKSGYLRALSKCLHRGKKTLVYEARVENSEQELISMARSTLMVIEA